METVTKTMRLLKNKSNERLVFLFLYYNSQLLKLNKNDIYFKHKYSVHEISRKLDMDRSNVWRYVKELEKKGLIDVINFDNKIEIIL